VQEFAQIGLYKCRNLHKLKIRTTSRRHYFGKCYQPAQINHGTKHKSRRGYRQIKVRVNSLNNKNTLNKMSEIITYSGLLEDRWGSGFGVCILQQCDHGFTLIPCILARRVK